jgi:hypothetical protein
MIARWSDAVGHEPVLLVAFAIGPKGIRLDANPQGSQANLAPGTDHAYGAKK